MKKLALAATLCAATLTNSMLAKADDRVARFDGGIGVIPVSRAAGTPNADGTFPNVVRNDVLGVPPGGQPWVIARLTADVRNDGHITVDGRGLLLAGGNGIGTNGNQIVHAVLFCGGAPFTSEAVTLEPSGDFRIDGLLSAVPPDPCTTPVLLIVSAGGAWFAAGIPKL
jgi:hypothetical protein